MRGPGVGRSTALALGLVFASGCAYWSMTDQVADVSRQHALVHGQLRIDGWGGEPLVVVASRDAAPGEPHDVDFRLVYEPSVYQFALAEGRYEFAVFEDSNGDLVYQSGHPAFVMDSAVLVDAGGQNIELDLAGSLSTEARLGARFDITGRSAATRLDLTQRNLGRVVALDDELLSHEMGSRGLWKPRDYLRELGAGIFFLEPYDPDRTPVLFVHGIAGAPAEFATMVERLDTARFQPWFFAYPSSLPVAYLGAALNEMLNILDRRLGFDRLHVVAHSMGGLVVRAFLNEYTLERHDRYLRRFVTLQAPWGGADFARHYTRPPTSLKSWIPGESDAAALREEGPPARVAESPPSVTEGASRRLHISWSDLRPGSPFLASLFQLRLPPEVQYGLVFGFTDPGLMPGEPGDGVISLESQLRLEAQAEADDQLGGKWSHSDVLEDERAIDQVMRWLDESER